MMQLNDVVKSATTSFRNLMWPRKKVEPLQQLHVSEVQLSSYPTMAQIQDPVVVEEEYEVLPEHKPNPKVAVVIAGAAVGGRRTPNPSSPSRSA